MNNFQIIKEKQNHVKGSKDYPDKI